MVVTVVFVNGFAIQANGRVAIGDGVITHWLHCRPIDGKTNITVGVTSGVAKSFFGGQGLDSAGKMLYLDLAGSPMPPKARFSGGLPYLNNGYLITDSVSPAARTVGGLPVTSSGALAIGGGGSVPPSTDCYLYAVANEAGTYWVTEDGKYVVLSTECHLPTPAVTALVDEIPNYITTEADELLLV
jgi:hypothetical protein